MLTGDPTSYRAIVMAFNPARHLFEFAFEHTIVIMFKVLHSGLRLVDISNQLDARRLRGSLPGYLDTLLPKEWEVVSQLRPLWLPWHAEQWLVAWQRNSSTGEDHYVPALSFNTDKDDAFAEGLEKQLRRGMTKPRCDQDTHRPAAAKNPLPDRFVEWWFSGSVSDGKKSCSFKCRCSVGCIETVHYWWHNKPR